MDGHHHLHLCANVVLGHVIPRGMKVRRHFSFWPKEKSPLNRGYRSSVNWWLARKYRLADYFFDLTQCIEEKKFYRVKALARSSDVELMTHPAVQSEIKYLMGDNFLALLEDLKSISALRKHSLESDKVVSRISKLTILFHHGKESHLESGSFRSPPPNLGLKRSAYWNQI